MMVKTYEDLGMCNTGAFVKSAKKQAINATLESIPSKNRDFKGNLKAAANPFNRIPRSSSDEVTDIFSPPQPKVPPPPPVVTREDPAVIAARKKQKTAERLRRGRGATILTKDVKDKLGTIGRPQARSATRLGG